MNRRRDQRVSVHKGENRPALVTGIAGQHGETEIATEIEVEIDRGTEIEIGVTGDAEKGPIMTAIVVIESGNGSENENENGRGTPGTEIDTMRGPMASRLRATATPSVTVGTAGNSVNGATALETGRGKGKGIAFVRVTMGASPDSRRLARVTCPVR